MLIKTLWAATINKWVFSHFNYSVILLWIFQWNNNAQYNVSLFANIHGYYYNNRIGTENNNEWAFELHKMVDFKIANGNKVAQYNLYEHYGNGIGVEKNKIKTFELYKDSAKNEHLDANFQLRYCYMNGIETEVDEEKEFELYKIAAEKAEKEYISMYQTMVNMIEKDFKKLFIGLINQ